MLTPSSSWRIELEGSELARIEQVGGDMVIVLAAARVPEDQRQRGMGLQGGHLQGVRLRLIQARWEGQACAMVGRLDEVNWAGDRAGAAGPRSTLIAPSSAEMPICLSLRTALGDALVVWAQAWRVEWREDGGRFTPSLAC